MGLSGNSGGTPNSGGINSLRNSKLGSDLTVLDKLVTSILERHQQQQQQQQNSQSRLQRLRSLTRSRNNSVKRSSIEGGIIQSSSSTMPTIMETNAGNNRPSNSWSERSMHVPGVRQIINTLTNAPHSFTQNGNRDEESANMLD